MEYRVELAYQKGPGTEVAANGLFLLEWMTVPESALHSSAEESIGKLFGFTVAESLPGASWLLTNLGDASEAVL